MKSIKEFFKKHKINIIIILVIAIFIVVTFYMLWVHVPYSNHQNEIRRIQNQIVEEYNYQDVSYFNEYNGESTFYIMIAKQDNHDVYAVFDKDYKFIKSYTGTVVNQDTCIANFQERYNQTPSEVTIGYENEIFVYSLKYQGRDNLIYAYYGIDNGNFVKAYQL